MSAVEVEVKFAVSDAEALAGQLLAIGFRELTPSTFERNTLFDTPEHTLRAARAVLRIRKYGERWVLSATSIAWRRKLKSLTAKRWLQSFDRSVIENPLSTKNGARSTPTQRATVSSIRHRSGRSLNSKGPMSGSTKSRGNWASQPIVY
jgi:hypothetical protein